MMLIVGVAEAFGLTRWGRWQPTTGTIKIFPVREAVVAEMAEMLLMAAIILVGAYFLKALGDTIHARNTFAQALTVVDLRVKPGILVPVAGCQPDHQPVGSVDHRHHALHQNPLPWRATHHAARPAGCLRTVFHERAVADDGDRRGTIYHQRIFSRAIQTRRGCHLPYRGKASPLI